MIWIELGILLLCIVIGARLGGMALGPIAGIGLLVFVFVFHLPPGKPPAIVLGMIIAVVTALAAMEAAGGLDYLILVAERILHRNPRQITFIAPLVTYVLIFAAGTQHVIYALLPVIAEVSRNAGIRPERPISISVIAAQYGLIASPISAATVAMLGVVSGYDIGLAQIMLVIVPATLVGTVLGALSVAWRGPDLEDDPVYRQRLADGLLKPPQASRDLGEQLPRARGSTLLFLLGIAFVVLVGLVPELRPAYEVVVDDKARIARADPAAVIMIVMLVIAGLILIFFKAKPEDVMKGSVMRGGLLQLNAYEPVAAGSILESQRLLTPTLAALRTKCVDGIQENRAVNREHFDRSVGIVTALNPVLGYEKTTELAAEAMRTNRNVLDLVREQGLLDEKEIEKLLDTKALTGQ